MRHLILIAHNLRSSHNIGSLLRTAEGLGVAQVILSGYTPYPLHDDDSRLPHIAVKVNRHISKTALGAEHYVPWKHVDDLPDHLTALKRTGFCIAAVEQSPAAQQLPSFQPPEKVALIVGREVEGMEAELLALCDIILEIPMFGHKESFNVVQAAAMGLYHCRFHPFQ
jgi:23S rRNA (guanosine2251-2'-O)-methyltransferase